MLTGATDLPGWWPDGWRNKLIWGDNKYVLASLLDEFAGKVDLIYIDPPFASRGGLLVMTGSTSAPTPSFMEWQNVSPMLAIEELAYRDTWSDGVRIVPEQMMYDRLDSLIA